GGRPRKPPLPGNAAQDPRGSGARQAATLVSETELSASAPAPLPLADLLAALRDRGMALGVREHLAVGHLLSRFDDLDLDTLRVALAAVLARRPGEGVLVRETFDQLYRVPPEALTPPSPRPDRRERLAQTWSRSGRLR